MKWFKHISDSLTDPFISMLLERHGPTGYLVFFGCLEVYAREWKPDPGWVLRVSRAYLARVMAMSRSDLVIKALKSIKESGKWEVEFSGPQDRDITIFIPKFNELMSDAAMRKLRVASDDESEHRPETERLRDLDLDKDLEEEEEEKEKTPHTPQRGAGESGEKGERGEQPKGEPLTLSTTSSKTQTKTQPVWERRFDEFWEAYPKKRGKGAARKAWAKLKPDEQLFSAMMRALERAKTSADWRKDGGQYIPNPSTWLNQERWEDDYSDTPPLRPAPRAQAGGGFWEQPR